MLGQLFCTSAVLGKRDITVELGEECYLSHGYHHAGSVVLDIICFGGGGRRGGLVVLAGEFSCPASLTPSLP